MRKFFSVLVALTLGVAPAFSQQSYDKQVKMGDDFVLKDRDSIVSSNQLATIGQDISGSPSNSTVVGLHGSALPAPSGGDAGKVYQWNGAAWILAAGGGGAATSAWGTITGTITNQTDLWTELTNRYTKAEADGLFLTSGDISDVAYKSQYNQFSQTNRFSNNTIFDLPIGKYVQFADGAGFVRYSIDRDGILKNEGTGIDIMHWGQRRLDDDAAGNPWTADGTANNGNEIVNWITLTNQGYVSGNFFDLDSSNLMYTADSDPADIRVWQIYTTVDGDFTNELAMDLFVESGDMVLNFITAGAPYRNSEINAGSLVFRESNNVHRALYNSDGVTIQRNSDTVVRIAHQAGLQVAQTEVGTDNVFEALTNGQVLCYTDATGGVDVVNYQTLTNEFASISGVAYLAQYNEFTSSNNFSNAGNWDVMLAGPNEAVIANGAAGYAKLMTATHVLDTSGAAKMSQLEIDGAGDITENADETTEIVNWQTMTNQGYITSADAGDAWLASNQVWTGENTFSNDVFIDGANYTLTVYNPADANTSMELTYDEVRINDGPGATHTVYMDEKGFYEGFTGGLQLQFGQADMLGSNYRGLLVSETHGDVNPVFAALTNGQVLCYTDATGGVDVVNYQTMTNWVTDTFGTNISGVAYVAQYNTFTSSNRFEGNIIMESGNDFVAGTNASGQDMRIRVVDSDGGKLLFDVPSTMMSLSDSVIEIFGPSSGQQVLWIGGPDGAPALNNDDGIWLSKGTATNGDEIVNFDTMNGQGYLTAEADTWQTVLNRGDYATYTDASTNFFEVEAFNDIQGIGLRSSVTQDDGTIFAADLSFYGGSGVAGSFVASETVGIKRAAQASISTLDGSVFASTTNSILTSRVEIGDTDGDAIEVTVGNTKLLYATTTTEATNGFEIVNWQTMTNTIVDMATNLTGVAYLANDQTFAETNTFTKGILLPFGSILTFGGEGFIDQTAGAYQLKDSAGQIGLSVGTSARALADDDGTAVLDWDTQQLLANGDQGIWRSVGWASNATQIVNWQTMTNWVTDTFGTNISGVAYLANAQTFTALNTFTNISGKYGLLNDNTGERVMYAANSSLGHSVTIIDYADGAPKNYAIRAVGDTLFTGFIEVTSNAVSGTQAVNFQTMTNRLNDGTLAADFAVGRFRQEVVEVITNDVQLTLDDGGKCYIANGTAEITVSLPTNATASTVGTDFRFVNITTNLLTIDAFDTDYIEDSSLGAQIYSGIQGTNYYPYSSITLKQAQSNWWHSLAARGDWTTTGTNTTYTVPAPVRAIGGELTMTAGVTNNTVSYGATYTVDMYPTLTLGTNVTSLSAAEIVNMTRSNFTFRVRDASGFVTNGLHMIWNAAPAQ